MLYELDHLLRSGDEPPHGAEGLGEGPHDDLDIIVEPEMVDHTAPLRADHTKRMGLVDIHDGIIFLGCLHHRRQVSHVAGHTEDAIHDDEAARLLGYTLEPVAERIHGIVTVGNKTSRGDLTPLDDGGMVLTVTKDDIVRLGQGGKGTLVGKESGGKKQGAFTAKERS